MYLMMLHRIIVSFSNITKKEGIDMNVITWKKPSRLMAGTTLRDINLPENGNLALHTGGNLEQVLNNRRAFSDYLGISLQDWVCAKQTHSDHIKAVTAAERGRGAVSYEDGIEDCDALYTREKGLLLTIMTADCVPILLYEPIQEIICAIHAGWQGTVKEITAKALQHLIEVEHCDPRRIHAYIGPAIAASSFEVGIEVVQQVKAMSFPTDAFIKYAANEKAFIDNKGLNKQMLLNAGLKEHHISVDKNDTFAPNERFFSYRRDHSCGRHMSYIMMK